MADFTVAVMLTPADHPLPTEKHDRRYVVGDFVDVFIASEHADLLSGEYRLRGGSNTPRIVYVHVTGCPNVTLDQVKKVLLRVQVDYDVAAITNPVGKVLKRRDWNLVTTSIPNNIRNKLNADREITVTWTQVKNYAKRKLDNSSLTDTVFNG